MHIGTVGFNHREWDGHFYPADIRESERLAFYAKKFKAVEIGVTAHTIPRRDVFERWAAQTPSDFVFAFRVTYNKAFASNVEMLIRRASDTLGSARLGPICIIIPSTTKYYKGAAAGLFQSIPCGMKYALDIRSHDWLNAETINEAAARDIPLVRDHLLGGIIQSSWEYVRLNASDAVKYLELKATAGAQDSVPGTGGYVYMFGQDSYDGVEDNATPNAPDKMGKKRAPLNKYVPMLLEKYLGPGGLDSFRGNNGSDKSTGSPGTSALFEHEEQSSTSTRNQKNKGDTSMTGMTNYPAGVEGNDGFAGPKPKVDLK